MTDDAAESLNLEPPVDFPLGGELGTLEWHASSHAWRCMRPVGVLVKGDPRMRMGSSWGQKGTLSLQ